jgi:hypothetical protein
LQKNKNIEKNRPLVSYTPKQIYNVTAQAILFALNQDTIHQYALWKTQDLVPNLQKFNKHFNKSLQRANSGKFITTENGDIREMYTALDHGSVTCIAP